MMLNRQALSAGGVTCGGCRRGRKSSRYRRRRGMFLFLKLLGVESCLDSLCFGWLCPIIAKSVGLGANLPGLNLSSYTYSLHLFWEFSYTLCLSFLQEKKRITIPIS